MTAGLKPYPAYRGSGVSWLGSIPAGWNVSRGKQLFRDVTRPVRPEDEVVTCFRDGQVTLRRRRRLDGFTEAIQESGYQGVRRGDLVIHQMDAFAGAVGVSDSDGKASPVYAVCVPRTRGVDPDYFKRVVRVMALSGWIAALSKGIRERSTDFRFETFGQQLVPVPPPHEQTAIVRYLDHIDSRIHRVIAAKEYLVGLLEEQAAAEAASLMARPECRQARLNTIAAHQFRPVERKASHEYRALGLRNRGRGLFHKPPVSGGGLGDSSFFWVEPQDLIISGQFAWEGAIALASSEERGTIVSHRYYLLRAIEGQATTPYLWALLRSEFGAMLLDQHSRGAAGRNRPLSIRTLLKEQVPVPPLEKQGPLSAFVETLAPSRAQAMAAVALLREFRTRVISDVITGKLDVREATANLHADPDADDSALDEQLEEAIA